MCKICRKCMLESPGLYLALLVLSIYSILPIIVPQRNLFSTATSVLIHPKLALPSPWPLVHPNLTLTCPWNTGSHCLAPPDGRAEIGHFFLSGELARVDTTEQQPRSLTPSDTSSTSDTRLTAVHSVTHRGSSLTERYEAQSLVLLSYNCVIICYKQCLFTHAYCPDIHGMANTF